MSEKEYKNIDDFKQSEYYKRANDPKTRETIDSEIDDKFRQAGNGIGNLIHNVKILYQMICDKNFKIPNDKLVLIIAGLFYFPVASNLFASEGEILSWLQLTLQIILSNSE